MGLIFFMMMIELEFEEFDLYIDVFFIKKYGYFLYYF